MQAFKQAHSPGEAEVSPPATMGAQGPLIIANAVQSRWPGVEAEATGHSCLRWLIAFFRNAVLHSIENSSVAPRLSGHQPGASNLLPALWLVVRTP